MSIICVGSGSVIKKRAVARAFPGSTVISYDQARSGVPPQPIGVDQTTAGARNRCSEAQLNCPQADVWIGIENGMWNRPADGVLVDAAIIVIRFKESERPEIVLTSEELVIPPDPPFDRGPNGEWSVLKDPHVVITKGEKDRETFLFETL
eukprot:PhF_6_TR24414/c0_g1_i1/m.33779